MPTFRNDVDTYSSGDDYQQPQQKRRRTAMKPEKPGTAFSLFFEDTIEYVAGNSPGMNFTEMRTVVKAMWSDLPAESINMYAKRLNKAERRYERELRRFLKHRRVSSDDESDLPSLAFLRNKSPVDIAASVQPSVTTESASMTEADKARAAAKRRQDKNTKAEQEKMTTTAVVEISECESIIKRAEKILMEGGGALDQEEEKEKKALHEAAVPRCKKNGCPNEAVTNPQWNYDYCSTGCVIAHSKAVFQQFLQHGTPFDNFC